MMFQSVPILSPVVRTYPTDAKRLLFAVQRLRQSQSAQLPHQQPSWHSLLPFQNWHAQGVHKVEGPVFPLYGNASRLNCDPALAFDR